MGRARLRRYPGRQNSPKVVAAAGRGQLPQPPWASSACPGTDGAVLSPWVGRFILHGGWTPGHVVGGEVLVQSPAGGHNVLRRCAGRVVMACRYRPFCEWSAPRSISTLQIRSHLRLALTPVAG